MSQFCKGVPIYLGRMFQFKRYLKSLFNYTSTNMIVIASYYKSLTASKSMPQKNNHDFKGKYPYVRVGTLVSMRIKDILNKNTLFFVLAF